MKGISFSIMDNSANVQSQVALISVRIRDLVVKLKSCQFEGMKPEVMEHWFNLDQVKTDFQSIRVYLNLGGTYYNRNSFADESFIERFPLRVFIRQETPMRSVKQMVVSDELLNLNLTYGLFCNIQRTLTSLLKVEDAEPAPVDRATEEARRIEYRKKQVSNCLHMQESAAEAVSISEMPSRSSLQSETEVEGLDLTEVSDVQFINKTGQELRLCLSNLELDLGKHDGARVVVLPGGESEIVAVHLLEEMLAETKDTLFRGRRHLLKIDFALQGF